MQRKILALAFLVFGFFLLFFGIKNFGKVIEEGFVEINLNKNKFFQHETIQIEIKGIFSRPIFDDDIKIKKDGLTMPVKFYVEKISNDYYIAYATLDLAKGKYDVEIKVYTQKGIEIFKKEVEIEESDNRYYLSLFYETKDKIDYLKNRELIYTTQAIEGIDENVYENMLSKVLEKVNNFDDLEKALLLLSLNTTKEEYYVLKNKLINYFLTIQDNELGNFILNIKGNTNCSINNVTYEILEEKNISIDISKFIENNSINISFSCQNENISVVLIKEYLGNVKAYGFEKENNTFYLKRKFGSFNNNQITSIMLVVFYKNNISQYSLAYDWIKENKEGIIERVALAYLNDQQAINELINYQNYDGSFDADRNFSKAEITCLAYRVIPTKSLAEKWIKNNIASMNIKDKGSCLVFALEKKDVVGFMPGMVKGYTGETFDLYLKNYGIRNVNISMSNIMIDLNYSTSLDRNQMKKLTIAIPFISYERSYLIDNIVLSYGKEQALIPILIFIKQTNQTIPEINESIERNITINQTNESLNQTVNFTIKVLSIIPEKINLSVKDPTSIKIGLKNLYKDRLNINVIKSASLEGVVTIDALQLTLMPNEEKDIRIYISPTNASMKIYEGIVEIEAKNDIKQYYQIPVNIQIETLETCVGEICKVGEVCEGNYVYTEQGICCLGKCKKVEKKENKNLGIILVIIGLIFLAAAVFFILKKPRKEKKIEEVIKKIQKKEQEKKQEKF